MKHLLIRLSAGLLLALMATINLPAVSQSPSASPSAPASPTGQTTQDPLRGVKLTPKQQSQLTSIKKDAEAQLVQMLTPEQKKVASTQGLNAVKLTKPQEQKVTTLVQKATAKQKAVFTPEQLKQIEANLKANGQSPVPSGQK
jgi:Spy/CpxP family protein refolding chaperone